MDTEKEIIDVKNHNLKMDLVMLETQINRLLDKRKKLKLIRDKLKEIRDNVEHIGSKECKLKEIRDDVKFLF